MLLHRLAAEHFILDDGPDDTIGIGESAQDDLGDRELGRAYWLEMQLHNPDVKGQVVTDMI